MGEYQFEFCKHRVRVQIIQANTQVKIQANFYWQDKCNHKKNKSKNQAKNQTKIYWQI